MIKNNLKRGMGFLSAKDQGGKAHNFRSLIKQIKNKEKTNSEGSTKNLRYPFKNENSLVNISKDSTAYENDIFKPYKKPLLEDFFNDVLGDKYSSQYPTTRLLIALNNFVVLDLVKSLKNNNWKIRNYSARVLGQIGDYRALNSLECLLSDPERRVRFSAEFAIKKIKKDNIKPYSGKKDLIQCNDQKEENKEDQILTLIEKLKYPDWEIKTKSARVLGQIGDYRALNSLECLLSDPERRVRFSAKFAIKKIKLRIKKEQDNQSILKTFFNSSIKSKFFDVSSAVNDLRKYNLINDEFIDQLIKLFLREDTDSTSRNNIFKILFFIKKDSLSIERISSNKSNECRSVKNEINENKRKNSFEKSKLLNTKKNPLNKKHVDAFSKTKKIYYSKNSQVTLNNIDAMGGYEFENFLVILFKKMGYHNVKNTTLSQDQGADLTFQDKSGIKTAVQAKRYQNKVGNRAVQEIFASLNFYNADKGMIVTNSTFTKQAVELAEVNNITLIDRRQLKKWIEDFHIFGEESTK